MKYTISGHSVPETTLQSQNVLGTLDMTIAKFSKKILHLTTEHPMILLPFGKYVHFISPSAGQSAIAFVVVIGPALVHVVPV